MSRPLSFDGDDHPEWPVELEDGDCLYVQNLQKRMSEMDVESLPDSVDVEYSAIFGVVFLNLNDRQAKNLLEAADYFESDESQDQPEQKKLR